MLWAVCPEPSSSDPPGTSAEMQPGPWHPPQKRVQVQSDQSRISRLIDGGQSSKTGHMESQVQAEEHSPWCCVCDLGLSNLRYLQ